MRPPRTTRRSASLVVAALLALLALRPTRPSAAAEPGSAKLQAAVTDLRNTGTAMYRWYQDEQKPFRHKAAPAVPPPAEDVTKVPAISYAELKALLVPTYLKELPRLDPWGHPYEYRLSQDPEADEVMVVRSAGAGGNFSGNVYEVGAFSPDDASQNVVWKDGYFVRWPQPQGK
jgi:hypothetical protein